GCTLVPAPHMPGEGRRLLRNHPSAVVITAQLRRQTTGIVFLPTPRHDRPDAIRLLFTGYADIKAVIDAINQGHVFRYITKPWDVDELQAVLRQAVERYDLFLERKKLLEELQQKNCLLEGMNAELRQANDLKDAFINVASHEPRTPVTMVMGLADLAGQPPGVADPLQQWLQGIHGGSLRLHRLIEQMTKFLAAGKFERPLARENIPLADLLHAAAEDMTP